MPHRKIVVYSDSFLDWLFAHGTRVVEFFNATLLIGFTIPLIYNLDTIISASPYPVIYLLGNPFWWSAMALVGMAQWYAMICKGIKSNQVSGYILIVSGWVWAMISSLFLVRTPLLTPAPIVYLVIAFTCTVAGLYLLRLNKKIEDRYTNI